MILSGHWLDWDTGPMCATCRATADVLLSEVARMVVLAEADAGLGDPSARRPLSDAERASKVRFSEITALEDDYLDTVTPVLEELRGVVDAEILAALAGATTAAALLDALEGLTATQPPAVTAAARDVAGAVETALETVYTGSSGVAIGEAGRQGVTRLPEPLVAPVGVYETAGRRVAAEPWARALEVVRRAADPQVLTGVLEADFVPMALAGYKQDGVIDLARQFQHGAANTGRFDTAEVLPFESAYSSEILDSNTCDACEREDGKEYATLAELRAAYGNGGGFRNCAGSARCRGTGILRYRT